MLKNKLTQRSIVFNFIIQFEKKNISCFASEYPLLTKSSLCALKMYDFIIPISVVIKLRPTAVDLSSTKNKCVTKLKEGLQYFNCKNIMTR